MSGETGTNSSFRVRRAKVAAVVPTLMIDVLRRALMMPISDRGRIIVGCL